MSIQKGDWVAEKEGRQPRLGKVLEVWDDGSFNLCVYTYNGENVGRVSPAEGGPTTFEPCVPIDNYQKIEKPTFPLKRDDWGGGWRKELRFL